jgi:RNA polymerase sigma-70 factor, ECF subfamily
MATQASGVRSAIPVRQDDDDTHPRRKELTAADLTAVLREIDDLAPALDGYPYLRAARPDLLTRLGRAEDAAAAYEEALTLTTNPVERRYLARTPIG